MDKKTLLKYCSFYKGEEQCPFVDNKKARLWMAEMMACNDLISMIGNESPADDLHRVVFAYVSKWSPYDFRDILNIYIKVAKPKQAIIDVYYS